MPKFMKDNRQGLGIFIKCGKDEGSCRAEGTITLLNYKDPNRNITKSKCKSQVEFFLNVNLELLAQLQILIRKLLGKVRDSLKRMLTTLLTIIQWLI